MGKKNPILEEVKREKTKGKKIKGLFGKKLPKKICI